MEGPILQATVDSGSLLETREDPILQATVDSDSLLETMEDQYWRLGGQWVIT
jgi:hypothetical protein